jgi:hypothetical protein
MASNPSLPEFDAAIDHLAALTALDDPDRLLTVLRDHPSANAYQLKRLWEVAVVQSAIGEVAWAIGEGTFRTAEWQERWMNAADALRESLLQLVTADSLENVLTAYAEEARAAAASPALAARVRHLEALLRGQRTLIGFHYSEEENPYRQVEKELSDRFCTPAISVGDRALAATRAVEETARYEAVYLPKLAATQHDVNAAFRQCTELLVFFHEQRHPNVHQWHRLTSELVEARRVVIAHIKHMLRFDTFLANQVLAGDVNAIDGAELFLSPAAGEELQSLGQESAALVARSAHKEGELAAERELCVETIIGPNSQATQADEAVQTVSPSTHPVERRRWFRFVKLCWWGVLAVWVLLSLAMWPEWPDFVVAITLGYAVLHGMKVAFFYVTLGRTTIREAAGSGFIDLDMFEQQVFEQNPSADADFQKTLAEFRTRYGSRVPALVMQKFVDAQLAAVRVEKKRLLLDADTQGKTISIDSLRVSLTAARPPQLDEDEYRLHIERRLLRLELKYGREIPVSAVDAEAESLLGA